MRGIVALSLALAASTCAAKEPKVIVLDGWWTIDYAKNACRLTLERRSPFEDEKVLAACSSNPEVEAATFLTSIQTEFASSAQCHGLLLGGYFGPKAPVSPALAKAASGEKAMLMVDYVPGLGPRQNWDFKGMAGIDTAAEIVRKVCTAFGGRGGTVIE